MELEIDKKRGVKINLRKLCLIIRHFKINLLMMQLKTDVQMLGMGVEKLFWSNSYIDYALVDRKIE
jgi:hypothetical protein